MSNVNDFVIENGVLLEYNGKDVEVTIPDGVKEIAGCVFSGCAFIENIVINKSTKIIGMGAFKGTNITSISISNSIKAIEPFTFEQCKALKTVTIEKSVKKIGMRAFLSCSSLECICFNGTVEEFLKISKADSWDIRTGDYVIRCTDGEISKLLRITYK